MLSFKLKSFIKLLLSILLFSVSFIFSILIVDINNSSLFTLLSISSSNKILSFIDFFFSSWKFSFFKSLSDNITFSIFISFILLSTLISLIFSWFSFFSSFLVFFDIILLFEFIFFIFDEFKVFEFFSLKVWVLSAVFVISKLIWENLFNCFCFAFGVDVNFNKLLSVFFSGLDGVSSFIFKFISFFLFCILFIFFFEIFFLLFDLELLLFNCSMIFILFFLKLPILFEANLEKTSLFSFFIFIIFFWLVSGDKKSSLAFLASIDLLPLFIFSIFDILFILLFSKMFSFDSINDSILISEFNISFFSDDLISFFFWLFSSYLCRILYISFFTSFV